MVKIPKHAIKVFEGMLFDVYHFEIMGTDGKPRIFERIRGYDVVKAICILDGKVLVTDEIHPDRRKMSLPGGMLHKNEDPLEGIKREVKEETGFEFSDRSLIVAFPLEKPNIEMNRYYYIAKNNISQTSMQLDMGGEEISLKEYAFDDFFAALKNGDLNLKDLTNRYQTNPHLLEGLLT